VNDSAFRSPEAPRPSARSWRKAAPAFGLLDPAARFHLISQADDRSAELALELGRSSRGGRRKRRAADRAFELRGSRCGSGLTLGMARSPAMSPDFARPINPCQALESASRRKTAASSLAPRRNGTRGFPFSQCPGSPRLFRWPGRLELAQSRLPLELLDFLLFFRDKQDFFSDDLFFPLEKHTLVGQVKTPLGPSFSDVIHCPLTAETMLSPGWSLNDAPSAWSITQVSSLTWPAVCFTFSSIVLPISLS